LARYPKHEAIVEFIRSLYPNETPVPLHAPRFLGNEKAYLAECIDTTFVSYVGKFVTDFENQIMKLTGAKNAVAIVNGTAALQMVLLAAGVGRGDEVITQALTFAATAAAIKHVCADPVFVDVDRETLGMSPDSLRLWLQKNAKSEGGNVIDAKTGKRIAAVIPMHTFGHPARIDEIAAVCQEFNIQMIEDAAESIGSSYKGRHTGTFGRAAVMSFNGNKPVTAGGGGMVITDDDSLAARIRHLSTTAKKKHPWEFFHDEVGYNLRMTNVNAAIGCAQMEYFDKILANKRETASLYKKYFDSIGIPFISEPPECQSNYWLNAIMFEDRTEREEFLTFANSNGIQTRPIWTLMTKLPPYRDCISAPLPNSEWLEDRVVNIPSSYRIK
jgi:perosamine synthetase